MKTPPILLLGTISLALAARGALTPAPPTDPKPEADPEKIAFFEKNIRPVLASKCYKCHSTEADKEKGGLRVDTAEAIRKGGDSGHAVVPGNAKESLLMKALQWKDKEMRMPPEKEGGQLPENMIADFEKWIAMGAADPRTGPAALTKKAIDWDEARQFWAFQAPKPAAAPEVKDTAWPRNDFDRFILAAQETKGLHPVADADKNTLLRRVYFDLVGLPPSPQEVAAFMADASPEAFAKVVDRLLASPQFGERWGRHWLDVARYAESTGKERNFTYPTAWRYRDYVFDALNADKPYDQFLREQMAGDLLPHASDLERKEHTVATGFLALGARSLQEKNPEQFRVDNIDEQIDTTTRAVLGLTVACARCHDHKFDPVPQKDYYSLSGIFRSTQTYYGTNYVRKGQKLRNTSSLIVIEAKPSAAVPSTPEAAPPLQSSQDPLANLSPEQRQRFKSLQQQNPAKAAQVLAMLSQRRPPNKNGGAQPAAKNQGKRGSYQQLQAPAKPGGEECMGVLDGPITNSRVLVRGEVDQPAEYVPRGFITVLSTADAPKPAEKASGRLELAQWLTSPQNPLTARVAVNRVWQHLFGQGIVRTSDNFGATGERPSHPELLDALALSFMQEGWSVKKLIRSVVLSHTYALASFPDAKGEELDPDNRLLWQSSQRRLDAEAIRDAILAASGQLDLKRPSGSMVSAVGDAYIGKMVPPERFSEAKTTYRSVYLPIVRDFAPEVLELFDFAEPSLVVAARDVTNVPAQALYLMNNDFVREQAAALAKRVFAAGNADGPRIVAAYQFALGRVPTPAERDRAFQFLRTATAELPKTQPELPYATFCQALFASAEFRYLR